MSETHMHAWERIPATVKRCELCGMFEVEWKYTDIATVYAYAPPSGMAQPPRAPEAITGTMLSAAMKAWKRGQPTHPAAMRRALEAALAAKEAGR